MIDSTLAYRLKRLMDCMGALALCVVASPLLALTALAILVDSGPPILFVQGRVGKGQRPFDCYKFRTMVRGALHKGRGIEVEKNDPRVTRVGRLLRPWGIDELPQLFNILRGDMSLVGPRPTVASQVKRHSQHQLRRLEVKPGLTGWAWIHGRNRLPWRERIEHDIWYVDNWSFSLDLRILWKTIGMVLRREGLYGDDGVARDYE